MSDGSSTIPKVMRCPCCGARGQLQTRKAGKSTLRNAFWRGLVTCTNNKCGVSTPMTRAPEAAVHIWNRRAPTSTDLDHRE